MDSNLQSLSKGVTGKRLLAVLQDVKAKVADIRTPLSIKKEIENEVRLGIIEALDSFLVEKLLVFNNDLELPNPDEHV